AGGTAIMTPDEIYAESMRLIEEEVSQHPFDVTEWPVVRRMIHASGDLALIRSVVFTEGAADAGIWALRDGSASVPAVSVVMAGISKPHAAALGDSMKCFIDDPAAREQSESSRLTRSACAMAKAVVEVGDAIYVVGNAPTALLTLCDAIEA